MKLNLIFYTALFLFIYACNLNDAEQETLTPNFKGKINNQEVSYGNSSLDFILGGGLYYTQRTNLGVLSGSNPNGVEITLFFDKEPTATIIEDLEGQTISFDLQRPPFVFITIYGNNQLNNPETTYAGLNTTGSTFKIHEIVEDNNFIAKNLGMKTGKAYLVKGTCNFKTQTLRVTDGEFVIRLVELK